MNEKSTPMLKAALIPGVILGVILIVISLITYFFDLLPKGIYIGTIVSFVTFLIRILILAIDTKKYRDKYLNGFIKYGKALAFGLIMGIYASVLVSVYTLAFNTVIAPDYTKTVTEKVQKMTIENLYEKGLPDEMIEASIKKMESKEFPSPMKTSALTLVMGIVFSFLASLISSIFVKKNEDPFQAMQDINEE